MKLLSFAVIILLQITAGCKNDSEDENMFHENWEVSPKQGAFRMDDWIVWGGSVIKADDGKYYMFASRWPKHLSMSAWVTNSEVVVAVSHVPEGPYTFQKVVLPARGKDFWDGMMTHNPSIQYHNGKYVLYYIGTTYDFEQPQDTIPDRQKYEQAWNGKRIGVAVSDSPLGPFKRKEEPLLAPRSDNWDAAITSNPAPLIHEDGSVLLIYKSAPVPYPERNKNRTLQFGVARADHYLGPYERVGENNRIEFTPIDTDVEDPYIWKDDEKYYLLAKCMNDSITGESQSGFLATSEDGISWRIADQPKAYSKTLHLDDGTTETMKKLERPQVLIEDGQPTHVFFACRNKKDEIFNMVRPINTK
ncbi:MAG: glycoside hydrolase family protein [Bacteroidota bacterium]